MDFYKIKETVFPRKKEIIISANFIVGRTKDLMVLGKSFKAVWDEHKGLWSTDEYDVARLVDEDLRKYCMEKYNSCTVYESPTGELYSIYVRFLTDYDTNAWDDFKKYLSKVSDNAHALDTKVAFSNTEIHKDDYISKQLPYPLVEGPYDAYEKIMSTLYDPDERKKIEWVIGAIISGESKHIQKFLVFYGDPGTGKSTVLEIIQKLFEGYYTIFEAKALTSSSNVFATEAFRNNPLVAIQHDGDLSRIEDNSKLNSIVSHEQIIINEKYKSAYPMRVNCFLLMATNKPVKITDAKAGLIRRLIDVRPSGRKIEYSEFVQLTNQVEFELGAIANHCLKVFESMGKSYYSTYRPVDMMYKTDPFFNFVEDSFDIFRQQNGTTLKQAYAMYKQYCTEANIDNMMQMYKFREELKNYFKNYEDQAVVDNVHVRSYYSGFIAKKFVRVMEPAKKTDKAPGIIFDSVSSEFDILAQDYPAQYATVKEAPTCKWAECKTTLSQIDTTKLHYVRVPENHIVIDFDLKDENGNKSFEKNLEAASKFPKTYAELSKSGAGIHLHYIYDGDVQELSRSYDKDIEVKVFNGNSSLRRKLSKCNKEAIATINSGLPLKEVKKGSMVNEQVIKTEKGIRSMIGRNIKKEIHPATKPSVDFIFKILEDAYDRGVVYDVTDLRPAVLAFAAQSSHNSEYCIGVVGKMKFKSAEKDISDRQEPKYASDKIVFYDVEVFPNLFLVNWKFEGPENKVNRMINPTPKEIEELMQYKLIGFNCRRYDNHILYARMLGYSNEQLFDLSQRIVDGKSKNCFFSEAYNVSYTDIYDFSSKKQSLKKFEIELGIHHHELGLPWDQPVPEDQWPLVAEYCDDDVIATEAVWNSKGRQTDFIAREILASLGNGTVNDSTNSLTGKLIFGSDTKPQSQFHYRNLAEPVHELDEETLIFLKETFPEMMGEPHGKAKSLLPYFEGYEFHRGNGTEKAKSSYKDVDDVGEGGRVWSKPGMYGRTKTFDVASQHPHSIMAECLFGPNYTRVFRDLVRARVCIKHKDWDKVRTMLNGKLAPFVERVEKGELSNKDLAGALKIAINSVYGLTAAGFDNKFRDDRNIDNIVAKRGALFMIDLKEIVEQAGGEVIHIKTDSIKVVDPTPEIEELIINTGKRYGYSFEVEHVFEKICLVNDAVYIAKLAEDDPEEPGQWTATGAQFAVPYVFKTLFTHEPITFEDLCETKAVTSGALYLDMNEGLPEVIMYEDELANRQKKGVLYINKTLQGTTDDELISLISKGHSYRFVGKVGLFCPIKEGCGGGVLYRMKDDKYYAASGTTGYRWLESEVVQKLGKDGDIDESYYQELCNKAVAAISKYIPNSYFGDFETFSS